MASRDGVYRGPDDDPVGASFTFMVPETFAVSDMVVNIDITHTWVGDLCVTLEHDGVVVALIQRPGEAGACHQGFPFGCDSDNYLISLADGGAGGPIEDQCQDDLGSPPVYVPNQPLSAFSGMNAAGEWTLTVSDNAAGDVGTVDFLALQIMPDPCLGACCLLETCEEDVTQAMCDQMGGLSFAPLNTCDATCYGRCCDFGDCEGGCLCTDGLTEFGCVSKGEVFEFGGVGTHCTASPRGPACNPLERGACCLPTGNCMVMLELDCDGAGGTFEGLLSNCSIPPCRACCLPDGGCTYTSDPDYCTITLGGTLQGVTMAGGGSAVNACCFADGCCRRLTQELCESEGGTFTDFNSCLNCVASCDWDLDGSGAVEVLDLVALINAWGPCPGGCPADFDGNEVVGVLDLVAIIQNWGDCPPAAACGG